MGWDQAPSSIIVVREFPISHAQWELESFFPCGFHMGIHIGTYMGIYMGTHMGIPTEILWEWDRNGNGNSPPTATLRPSDPTRSYFLKVEGSKARCIDCNSLVSNKLERLRNHRKYCHSLSSSTRTFVIPNEFLIPLWFE